MLENDDKTELIEAFYKDLEFGTGGLRGIMGVGSNRMNIYTVGAATQGLSNYLKKNFKDLPQISVVVGHDCRNNSRLFAETSANIFSANGIKVYLFDDMRPTPEMSFAIRHLGCQSGIILTASHNPKEYNGYKAYWDDGAQVLAPHDKGIIDEVNAIASAADIKFQGNPDLIQIIGEDIDKIYLDMVKTVSIDPAAIARHKDMKIVYTPIHGTGMMLIPRALKMWGFENVFTVPEQMIKDGNFPTVVSPNPENAEALSMAVNLAKEIDADLVMASDPDADRVGIACKDDKGEWVLINGNQTCMMYLYYILTQYKQLGKIKGGEFCVKTIVTTELIKKIADKNNLMIYELLLRDFTETGDLQGAMQKLDYLERLGITAIELMPVQEFEGNDSWGTIQPSILHLIKPTVLLRCTKDLLTNATKEVSQYFLMLFTTMLQVATLLPICIGIRKITELLRITHGSMLKPVMLSMYSTTSTTKVHWYETL